ncbi:histone-arginine methyltransferase METTL23 [Bactrocera neohumeralis]|uniref:methyltransferase-like protein 23 n=1 Tax=Bactrocera tryoni TaxID=59916 RepID=UPI001A95C407|nr:methyltransferase-like protein 23 [Bactrocera tryoni]XP_050317236.1 histone-arginine methyltransferase METTL23 [Bactrocera neohumeralis]
MTSGYQVSEESDNEQTTTAVATVTATTSTAGTQIASVGAGSNEIPEHIRKFVFTNQNTVISSDTTALTEPLEKVEVQIPELLQSGYSFYTWPCAPVLAWFLWENRRNLVGKRVLELGAGTALPGILAAKCGARVILSDSCILPKSLAHIRKSCLANNLVPGQDIEVIGLSWGLLLNSVFNIGPLDLIIGADCFYDPSVFEDILVTISFLLERNKDAKFICTYQERSADWSIEALLKKWKLRSVPIIIDNLGKSSGVDLLELMGNHTIHLLEITKER